jgi:hypothetical protein
MKGEDAASAAAHATLRFEAAVRSEEDLQRNHPAPVRFGNRPASFRVFKCDGCAGVLLT